MNPCLDLQAHYESEKENKFFYKQFLKEVSKSYGISEKEAEAIRYKTIQSYPSGVPVHIWQRITGSSISLQRTCGSFQGKTAKARLTGRHDISFI